MKIKIFLVLFIMFQFKLVSAQRIEGVIKLDNKWKSMLYLKELPSYDIVFANKLSAITDSISIGKDGRFVYNNLKKNTLYSLNVVPVGENGAAFIQDGESDNYAFFITNEKSTITLMFSADIKSFYISNTIKSNDAELNVLLDQVANLRKIKFKHIELMQQFDQEMQLLNKNDSDKIEKLKMKTMQQFQRNDDSLNIILAKYAEQINNPLVLSLALVYYGFDFHLSDPFVKQASLRLANAAYTPLSQSILKVTLAPKVELAAFMDKSYVLISGDTFVLSDIKSDFILLDFWASWCVPCRKEIKTILRSLDEKFTKSQLTIIGIATDKKKENAIEAIKKDNNRFMQIYDNDESLQDLFEVKEIPHKILINRKRGTVDRIFMAESVDDIIAAENND